MDDKTAKALVKAINANTKAIKEKTDALWWVDDTIYGLVQTVQVVADSEEQSDCDDCQCKQEETKTVN